MNHTALTIAVMAGGKSSRMGTDKSFVPFLGKPMIERVLTQVQGLANEMILITNNPVPYAYLGLPMAGDIYPECGPLGGLHTALHHAANDHVLVIACDMPWLQRPLLEHMISLRHTADIVIPRWLEHPEPLHAIYSKACLLPIENRLKARQFKLVGFFADVTVHYLERQTITQFDPEGQSFSNINTPEELQRWEKGE
jgi:molybdenum cofactor guanylyltransferase